MPAASFSSSKVENASLADPYRTPRKVGIFGARRRITSHSWISGLLHQADTRRSSVKHHTFTITTLLYQPGLTVHRTSTDQHTRTSMRSASASGGRSGGPVWTEVELGVLRQCVRENGLDNWGLGCWKEVRWSPWDVLVVYRLLDTWTRASEHISYTQSFHRGVGSVIPCAAYTAVGYTSPTVGTAVVGFGVPESRAERENGVLFRDRRRFSA